LEFSFSRGLKISLQPAFSPLRNHIFVDFGRGCCDFWIYLPSSVSYKLCFLGNDESFVVDDWRFLCGIISARSQNETDRLFLEYPPRMPSGLLINKNQREFQVLALALNDVRRSLNGHDITVGDLGSKFGLDCLTHPTRDSDRQTSPEDP